MTEAGISLSKEDTVLLSRIFCDYLKNTSDGKRTAFALFNTETRKADSRHAYYPAGRPGLGADQIKAEDLIYYSGWIYKEKMGLSTQQIEVDRNGALEACDVTGILGPKDYCIKKVQDFSSSDSYQITSMSNYARSLSENRAVRDTSDPSKCRNCPIVDCDFHSGPKQLLLTTGK